VDIAGAIANKQLLQFGYGGYSRIVEPHTYGLDKKGQRALVGYQVSGGSQSKEHVGWKTFHEAEMRDVCALSKRFRAPRPEYRRGDGAFASIIAEL
jgi:hypothetical protein